MLRNTKQFAKQIFHLNKHHQCMYSSHNATYKIVAVPTPGRSSGDDEIDAATKQWRLTNTPDDEQLKKRFAKEQDVKKIKMQKIASLIPSHKDIMDKENTNNDDDDDEDKIIVGLKNESELTLYVNPHNAETGEYNGPTGKEPTRFGDWERKGRCFDF